MKAYAVFLSTLLLFSYLAGGAPPDFGPSGSVVTTAFDNQGRLLIVGRTTQNNNNVAAIRVKADGTLDTDFGVNGLFQQNFEGSSDLGHAIALDDSSNILIGGEATLGGSTDFVILRLTSTGVLDTSFNSGGTVPGTNNFDFNSNADSATAISFDSTNRILIAGLATVSETLVFGLARFTSTGTLDTTFGVGGSVTHSLSSLGLDEVRVLVIDSSDRFIIVGIKKLENNKRQLVLTRLNADGSFDTILNIPTLISNHITNWKVVINSEGVLTQQQLVRSNLLGLIIRNTDGSHEITF